MPRWVSSALRQAGIAILVVGLFIGLLELAGRHDGSAPPASDKVAGSTMSDEDAATMYDLALNAMQLGRDSGLVHRVDLEACEVWVDPVAWAEQPYPTKEQFLIITSAYFGRGRPVRAVFRDWYSGETVAIADPAEGIEILSPGP